MSSMNGVIVQEMVLEDVINLRRKTTGGEGIRVSTLSLPSYLTLSKILYPYEFCYLCF